MFAGSIGSETWEGSTNAWRLPQIFQRSSCSFPACSNVSKVIFSINGIEFLSPIVSVTCWSCLFSCRYDAHMKKLKHMRPIPEKLLQSLDGELDFLGPYPSVLKLEFSIATFKSLNFICLWPKDTVLQKKSLYEDCICQFVAI